MSCEQSEKLLQLDLALVSCDRLLASLSAQRTTYSDRWAELWLPSCREPGFDSLIPLLRNAVVGVVHGRPALIGVARDADSPELGPHHRPALRESPFSVFFARETFQLTDDLSTGWPTESDLGTQGQEL